MTFFIFKIIENKIAVLFYFTQQINLSNFCQQMIKLFAKATSFLNEIIYEINVIFDEPNISQIRFTIMQKFIIVIVLKKLKKQLSFN